MRKWVAFIVFNAIILSIVGQKISKFSSDPTLFPKEFKKLLGTNLSKEEEEFVEAFIMSWDNNLYTENEKKNILIISNKLLDRNIRPMPGFLSYIKLVDIFSNNTIDSLKYYDWENGFLRLLDKKRVSRTKIKGYISTVYHLIKDSCLVYKTSVKWKVPSYSFNFLYDKEPYIDFKKTNLICYAVRSQIEVFETKGKFYPITSTWKGKGGLVTWERAGYKREDVNAVLSEYQINMSRLEYKADSVSFTNKFYFDTPIQGRLHDKVKVISKTIKASYPRFDSYTKRFFIEDFYDRIDYDGGFSMRGEKLLGTGTREKKATLYFYKKNDSLALRAYSEFFSFRPKVVNSNECAVVIPFANDSIYHPSINLNFKVEEQKLSIVKNETALSKSPFFNTYHKVDMDFEQILWNINESNIRFAVKLGSAIGNASFESVNFFNLQKYESIQRYDYRHPLAVIISVAKNMGTKEYLIHDLVDYMRLPISQVKMLVLELSINGFVDYNTTTDMITIKQRSYDYQKARLNKIDYDVISFGSTVQAPKDNGVLNLDTYDFEVNGVESIFLSDSQNVVIVPYGKTITLKKNRDFFFNGIIRAGLFTYFGKDFSFSYDNFSIDLKNVDSLSMNVITDKRSYYKNPIVAKVGNIMEDIKGELLIDKPDNKSGRVNHPEYPIFKSTKNSFVYYDSPDLFDSKYVRDSFYFEVYPYIIDSLDNFDKNAMAYDGIFRSGSIFPDFEEKIRLQEDFSLGFKTQAPSEGYPVYTGTGKYYSHIYLSNKGLRGKGTLTYLTSTVQSDDFVFHIDSMNTTSKDFHIAKNSKGIQFPEVKSKGSYIHWEPYKDQLFAHQKEGPFDMFEGKSQLYGDLQLEPTGLLGKGRQTLENAELRSNLFAYNEKNFNADTADFYLKPSDGTDFTFVSKNVSSHIDFEHRKGLFRSNGDASRVDFVENKYISYVKEFTWNMDKEEIIIGNVKPRRPYEVGDVREVDLDEGNLKGATFVSVHSKQDSLNWKSPYTVYNLRDKVIDASLVKFIKVADAAIFPNKGKVFVEPDANMKQLDSSKILANTDTKRYVFYDASSKIYSKKDYKSNGKYDYIDENDKKQAIKFKEIKVDTSFQTIAEGTIVQPEKFMLSPVYQYQGKAFIESRKQFLFWNGATQLQHFCDNLYKSWVDFEAEINPRDIYIPISEKPIDINKNRIYAGTYLTNDSIHVYPSFLSPRKTYSDNLLVTSDGFLFFDKNSNTFKIGAKHKIQDEDTTGQLLTLHREYCLQHGEGKLNLGVSFGQFKIFPYGSINYNKEKDETSLDMVLEMNFHFSEAALDIFAEELKAKQNLKAVNHERKVYKKSVAEILGAEEAKKVFNEHALFGSLEKIPNELKTNTLTLTDLKLKWNPITESYRSEGPIGIGNILGNQINKLVKGKIELIKKRSGDIMHLLFELGDNNWYFFSYTRGNMMTFSSNQTYVNTIKDLKLKARKQKVKRGQIKYTYMVATDHRKAEVKERLSDGFIEQLKQEIEQQKEKQNNTGEGN